MIKGTGSPEKSLVFFKAMPDNTIAPIPTKYAEGATQLLLGKKAPATKAIIGSFAEQGIKVVNIAVIRRSFSLSIVRLAITPGTPQPVAISIGMKDFPDNPNLRKIRSITKAMRDIYPQSSNSAKHRKRTINCGRNPKTAPTPAIIPSNIRLCIHSATFQDCSVELTKLGTISPNK